LHRHIERLVVWIADDSAETPLWPIASRSNTVDGAVPLPNSGALATNVRDLRNIEPLSGRRHRVLFAILLIFRRHATDPFPDVGESTIPGRLQRRLLRTAASRGTGRDTAPQTSISNTGM